MNIQQLHSAVLDARSRRDYESCFQMLDHFLETAIGEDRGQALRFKAGVVLCDMRRAPEGLTLVSEAMELLHDNPEQYMRCLTTALGLCVTLGDVDKASLYEGLVHQVLQTHGGNQGIKNMQFRPYINFGLLANLRGQHPTAYWHFVQAVACIEQADITQEEARVFLLRCFLQIAESCVHMGRGPEAAEALERARPLVRSKSDLGRWTTQRSHLLRSQKRFHEAEVALDSIAGDRAEWHPSDLSRYHLERGLVAQDLGDIRHFHSHVSVARQIAEEHSEEFLLCEIQRAQRAPIMLEVVK